MDSGQHAEQQPSRVLSSVLSIILMLAAVIGIVVLLRIFVFVPYEIPEGFDVADYFRSSYGVTGVNAEPELVRLKVAASQVKYFRTLPLHHTQDEVETTDNYSVFSYLLVPTYELRQEILSHGSDVEVLSPASLREQIKEEIAEMHKLYK